MARYIRDYTRQHGGIGPSFSDIQHHVGLASRQLAQYHVRKLIADGLVERESSKPRTLRTTAAADAVLDASAAEGGAA